MTPTRRFPGRALSPGLKPRAVRGFTLVELMIVVAIIAVLSTIAVPRYFRILIVAKTTVAIEGIKDLQDALDLYEAANGKLPLTLDDLGGGPYIDPWGNDYQYLNFSTIKGKGKGKLRKDKFLVPLNSTYDLYSMGPDGESQSPLTAKASHDDIIRSNDGDFVGVASSF